MRRVPALLVAIAAVALLHVSPGAQRADLAPDQVWPHWRGPMHTGVAPGPAPVRWDDTTNVAWKVDMSGRGHSSPVVWGDRVFVTTAVPTGRTVTPAGGGAASRPAFGDGGAGAHEEHEFVVMALDRESGRVLWRQVATTAAPHEGYHHRYGSFASHSPATDGERLYVSFGSRGVFAYDFDGGLVWQRDFDVRMQMFLEFGEGVGPVVEDGRLILLFDHDGGSSFLTMLDAATGRDLWRTPREEGTNWSTPLVVSHEGRRQIVVSATQKVRSYDFDTGTLIWEVGGLGQNSIPRPVQHGDLVIVMTGFRNPNLMAIRLGRTGDLTGTDAIAWTMNRGLSYTASPLLHEGRLYFITDSGMITSVDAATGTPYYQQVRMPAPTNFKASPVAAGGHLYLATEEGTVIVARLGDTFEVVATNELSDQSFVSSPAVVDGGLILRSRTHLFRISGS
jgi:outer membrane protein assembly factor BamB